MDAGAGGVSVPLEEIEATTSLRKTPSDGFALTAFTPKSSSGLPLFVLPHALAAAEGLTIFLSAIVAKAVYLDVYVGTDVSLQTDIIVAACMGVALYAFYLQMGLYDVGMLIGPQIGFGKLIGGIILAFLTVLGLLYATKQIGPLSRGWFVVWFCLSSLTIIVIRILFSGWVKRGTATGRIIQRIAIVGSSNFVLNLAKIVRETEELSGAIDLYHCGPEESDIRFVGGLRDLETAMADRPYDRVVVAIPGAESDLIRTAVRSLGAFTTELLLCTDLKQMPVATSGTRRFGGVRTDIVHLVPLSERSGLTKRGVDILVAAIGLVLLAPAFMFVALAIKRDSRGPVFFRQRRLGQNGSIFRIYKFRSMTVEEDGHFIAQATRNDKRVTPVGRILRSTSFDELPQLINVLAGEMSIVGPRPHAIAHDMDFEQKFDLFARRRRVKPGITGWAQVNGFRGEAKTPEDVRKRMEYDLHYIDNWSIWFDLEIMIRTVFVMARGAY